MEPKKFPVLFCFLQMLQKYLFKKKKNPWRFWSKLFRTGFTFAVTLIQHEKIKVERYWWDTLYKARNNHDAAKQKLIFWEDYNFFQNLHCTVDLSVFYVVTVKSTVEISQNFVAFSEYMNFKYNPLAFLYGRMANCFYYAYQSCKCF